MKRKVSKTEIPMIDHLLTILWLPRAADFEVEDNSVDTSFVDAYSPSLPPLKIYASPTADAIAWASQERRVSTFTRLTKLLPLELS